MPSISTNNKNQHPNRNYLRIDNTAELRDRLFEFDEWRMKTQ